MADEGYDASGNKSSRTRLHMILARIHGVGWIWWVFAIGFLADLFSTGWMFFHFGTEVEAHPVIRLVGEGSGPWTAALLGKAGQLAGLAVLMIMCDLRIMRVAILVAGIVYFLAALFNVWQTMVVV
jgi:hypothetical protein